MTPHISGTSLSAQSRYAAGTREILECYFENRPIRNEYLIVQGGQLAGVGALSVRPHAAARAQLLSTSPLPRLSVPVAALSTPFQLPPERPRPRAVCAAAAAEAEAEPRVARLRDRLWSVGWTSWWTQTILSVVSGVLLLFANSVMQRPSPALVGGLVLALAGLGTAFCSIFWTWGFTRVSVRLGRQPLTPSEAAKRARGSSGNGSWTRTPPPAR